MSDAYYKILFTERGAFHHDDMFLQPEMSEINLYGKEGDNNTQENNFHCIRCWVSDRTVYYGRLDEKNNNFHINGNDSLLTKLGNEKKDIGFLMATKYKAKTRKIIKEFG